MDVTGTEQRIRYTDILGTMRAYCPTISHGITELIFADVQEMNVSQKRLYGPGGDVRMSDLCQLLPKARWRSCLGKVKYFASKADVCRSPLTPYFSTTPNRADNSEVDLKVRMPLAAVVNNESKEGSINASAADCETALKLAWSPSAEGKRSSYEVARQSIPTDDDVEMRSFDPEERHIPLPKEQARNHAEGRQASGMSSTFSSNSSVGFSPNKSPFQLPMLKLSEKIAPELRVMEK